MKDIEKGKELFGGGAMPGNYRPERQYPEHRF